MRRRCSPCGDGSGVQSNCISGQKNVQCAGREEGRAGNSFSGTMKGIVGNQEIKQEYGNGSSPENGILPDRRLF